tara:strand:+ start:1237 stop:1464 length:228 start_codon:yes stop_codon:yes gene_type:complete
MFRKCIIDQVIIEGSLRGKSLEVIQRYLSIFYSLRASNNVLKKRKRYLWLSGKVRKVVAKTFNNAWKTTYNIEKI